MAELQGGDWEIETEKTHPTTGPLGPWTSSLELGITASGKIAGKRYFGTAGITDLVGGVIDGQTIRFWFLRYKTEPNSTDGPWEWASEFSGNLSATNDEFVGTWQDVLGSEGTFRLYRSGEPA